MPVLFRKGLLAVLAIYHRAEGGAITLPRNVLVGILLLVLAWGGAAGIAYAIGHRAESRISDYSKCEQQGWATYQAAVAKYRSTGNVVDTVKLNAAYDLYAAEHTHCADGL
jgi:hypothetical protein